MRSVLLAMLLPASVLMPVGCASLDATHDYDNARTLIMERTGVPQVYDNASLDSASAWVASALEDGISLEEAIGIALLNNPAFQSQFLGIGVSRAELAQSQLLSNPTLSFSVGVPDIAGRSNLSGSLVQSLVELWQLPIRKRIAETQLERSILQAAATAIDLRAAVKKKFFEILALTEALPKIEENIRLLQTSLDLAQRQFDEGDTGIQDVNLARAALLDGQRLLIEMSRQRRLAATELARLMGISQSATDIQLSGALPEAATVVRNFTDLLILATQQRLDGQAAVLGVRLAEQDLRRERLARVPSFSLGVEAERPEEARQDTSANSDRTPQEKVIDLLVGPSISLTLPIWDRNQAQIRKAEILIDQRRRELVALLDSVAAQVADGLTVFDAAGASVALLRNESLPLAIKNVELARSMYEAGEQSVFPLLYAQQALLTQERSLAIAQADFGAAYAELERAVGGNLDKPMDADTANDAKKVTVQ